jgi:hydrogenase nickel incorporation protein HypB
VFDFDIAKAKQRAQALNPRLDVIPLSAETGEGFDTWIQWILERIPGNEGN